MRHLIGARTLTNLLMGRYHQPIREERLFVIFDLRESTRIAAAIGDERFHRLLSSIFGDADREIVDHGGEVHSYVGDALIATWPLGDRKWNARAVMAAFAVLDDLAKLSQRYRKRFGVTPQFRAALHGGAVIAGECGDSKRQITYLGDVLNVASRLEQVGKSINADCVVSAEILERIALPASVHVHDRGEHTLNGLAKPLHVYSLTSDRTPASDRVALSSANKRDPPRNDERAPNLIGQKPERKSVSIGSSSDGDLPSDKKVGTVKSEGRELAKLSQATLGSPF